MENGPFAADLSINDDVPEQCWFTRAYGEKKQTRLMLEFDTGRANCRSILVIRTPLRFGILPMVPICCYPSKTHTLNLHVY